jgi:putative phosphoesterase
MLIGIISDTHDKLATIDSALRYFVEREVSMIIHAGDWKSISTLVYFTEQCAALQLPVRGVLGNNDIAVDEFKNYLAVAPGDIRVVEGGMDISENNVNITVYHGHHAPTLRKLRARDTIDVLILGHSHKPLIENDGTKLIVNPGSTAFAIPRSKTWVPTIAILDTVTITATIHPLS